MADGKSESDQPSYQEHRPRLRQGLREAADPLPDYELLELLLFHAIPRRDVKPLAKRLIKEFGGFGRVLAAPRAELTKAGLGDTTIDLLKATHESSVRLLRGEAEDRDVLSSGQKVIDFCRANPAHADVEEFHLLFLDRTNRLIRPQTQQRGAVDH